MDLCSGEDSATIEKKLEMLSVSLDATFKIQNKTCVIQNDSLTIELDYSGSKVSFRSCSSKRFSLFRFLLLDWDTLAILVLLVAKLRICWIEMNGAFYETESTT